MTMKKKKVVRKASVEAAPQPIKRKVKRIRKNVLPINAVLTLATILANFAFVFILFGLTQYSSFSKNIFLIINIVVMLAILFMNLVVLQFIQTRKVNLLKTAAIYVTIACLIGTYGSYAVGSVNKNVNKIVSTSGTTTEVQEYSFVEYSGNGSYRLDDENALEGKTVGILADEAMMQIAKKEADAKKINITFKEYVDYDALLADFFGDQLDAAFLPSNYYNMFYSVEDYVTYLDNTKAIYTFSKTVTQNQDTGSDKDITTEPFTILIMGTAEGLADSIMLASFNPISMNVTLTSIARDSWVPIACASGKASNKINSARGRSRQCMIDTVEDLVGVEIDFYFESNFKGVVDIVDALGGVTLTNPYSFTGQDPSSKRGHYTVYVPAGVNVPMSGAQALAFARERKLYAAGDFQRQKNQQQVIQAILDKAMKLTDVNKALAVLDAAGENVSTNISIDQLISLFNHSMKKMERSYAKDSSVVNIHGSRVTGYNSGIWNEGMGINISIVRVYEGSIKDNREAIQRNIDMTSKIDAPKTFSFDATWEFTSPSISNETYSEKIIKNEIPEDVLQKRSQGCTASGGWWDEATNKCGCPAGFKWDSQSSSCIKDETQVITCPAGANCDENGKVVGCQAGYKMNDAGDGCIKEVAACNVEHGICDADGKLTGCEAGYELNADKTGCVVKPAESTPPTISPSTTPTTNPSTSPTTSPDTPTQKPTDTPTQKPTDTPTNTPTADPTPTDVPQPPTTDPTPTDVPQPTTDPTPTDVPQPTVDPVPTENPGGGTGGGTDVPGEQTSAYYGLINRLGLRNLLLTLKK